MDTKVVRIDNIDAEMPLIQEAAALLDAGGLVAFPTETVYGIGCRVHPVSLHRLSALKGRDAAKRYTLHIADRADLTKYVPRPGIKGAKLSRTAWPGPLTLVFELDARDRATQVQRLGNEVARHLYEDGSIGIRCPDNPVASALLRAAAGPIVAPSANLAGQKPAADAGEVLKAFAGLIEMVVDGGPCRYGSGSTVALVNARGVTILRPGVYSQQDLQRMSSVCIVFICSGNTCRSPMAEGLFKKYLAEKLKCDIDQLPVLGYKIASAGTMEFAGLPASPQAVAACAARGVDIADHISRPLTPGLVEQSDILLCMTRAHCEEISHSYPQAADKCVLLAGNEDIPDPVGQPQAVFETCAAVIDRALLERIGELIR